MINQNFVILGVVIQLLGGLSYLLDTIKGKAKPNRASFLLWSIAPLIAFAAEIKQGVGIQSLMAFSVGFVPLLILITSFLNKKAAWKLSNFDYACGFLSIIGLILWYLTKVGNVAIFFSILSDGLASLPTVIKSYKFPETENGGAYLATTISAILTTLTITNWNFAHYAFPFYMIAANLMIWVLIKFNIGKIALKTA